MLTEKEVGYIANLSRIHITSDEKKYLTKDLAQILDYMDTLQQLDVTNIQPTSHVLPLKNVLREDKIEPSLVQNDVLKISVSQHKGFFKVPQVIE